MRRVEKQYDFWARWYDLFWGRYANRTTEKLLERVELSPDDRVLDIGCGTGAIERHILDKNPLQEITAVDLSEKMLARARKRSPGRNVRYVRAAASNLPFEADAFDLILSASVLHYIAEPRGALAEMKRVLKSNGRIYLLDWSRSTAIMRMRDDVLRRVDPAHAGSHSEAEITNLIEAAGLTVVDLHSFTFGTYSFFIAVAQPLGWSR